VTFTNILKGVAFCTLNPDETPTVEFTSYERWDPFGESAEKRAQAEVLHRTRAERELLFAPHIGYILSTDPHKMHILRGGTPGHLAEALRITDKEQRRNFTFKVSLILAGKYTTERSRTYTNKLLVPGGTGAGVTLYGLDEDNVPAGGKPAWDGTVARGETVQRVLSRKTTRTAPGEMFHSCRKDELGNAVYRSDVNVTAAALGWGFTHSSHFSNVMRGAPRQGGHYTNKIGPYYYSKCTFAGVEEEREWRTSVHGWAGK